MYLDGQQSIKKYFKKKIYIHIVQSHPLGLSTFFKINNIHNNKCKVPPPLLTLIHILRKKYHTPFDTLSYYFKNYIADTSYMF